jgi:hypothetical protein
VIAIAFEETVSLFTANFIVSRAMPTCITLSAEGADAEAAISSQNPKLHATIPEDSRPIIYIAVKAYNLVLSPYLSVAVNDLKYGCKNYGH